MPALLLTDVPERNLLFQRDMIETWYGSPPDDHWNSNNPAALAIATAERIRQAGLEIYLEVGTDDFFLLDDGAEFTPDGKFIYFNSARSGRMQVWRMKPDGSQQEQVTDDEFNNWFPHISPDGESVLFLSYMPDVDPGDHPFYKHVYLRMMPLDGGRPRVVAYLYGGQGTINVPSWSPDSRSVAFVSNSAQLDP